MNKEPFVMVVGKLDITPEIMSYKDFILLWEDAYKQNPIRWTPPIGFTNEIELPEERLAILYD